MNTTANTSTARAAQCRARWKSRRRQVGTSLVRTVYESGQAAHAEYVAWSRRTVDLPASIRATARAGLNDYMGAALLAFNALSPRQQADNMRQYMILAAIPPANDERESA
ncbi:hypothetical protein LGM69_25260 [Burkholderia multivorans]|nr:hypothetical protein [Burkholderia multivorans]